MQKLYSFLHNFFDISWHLQFINLKSYTATQLILLVVGFAFWAHAYLLIIKNAWKFKFIEMPVLVGCGNLAWEFIWSFVFQVDFGEPFQVGCKIWFFMDLFILYFTLKYGREQIESPFLKKYFYHIFVFTFSSWLGIIYFVSSGGSKSELAVVGALIINVVMSALYVVQLVWFEHLRGQGISYNVAWLKMLGTFMVSVVAFLRWSDNGLLLCMCVITFVLDVAYVYLYRYYEPITESLHVAEAPQINYHVSIHRGTILDPVADPVTGPVRQADYAE